MQTGLKPSSFGDYMDDWSSWSLLHPLRICFRLSARPNRWKWRGPSPTWVAPNNSQEALDGGAGDEVCEDGLQPSKLILNPRPMPRRLLVRNLMRPLQMADEAVGVCRQTSPENAMDLATGLASVHREEEHVGDEEIAEAWLTSRRPECWRWRPRTRSSSVCCFGSVSAKNVWACAATKPQRSPSVPWR